MNDNIEYIIKGAGDTALEMCKQNQMIVLFDETAPDDLADISVTHTGGKIEKSIKIGDVIEIGNSPYIVTAVGEDANKTLKTIGHATLKFTGNDKTALPGHIELKGDKPPQFIIGEKIRIIYNH